MNNKLVDITGQALAPLCPNCLDRKVESALQSVAEINSVGTPQANIYRCNRCFRAYAYRSTL